MVTGRWPTTTASLAPLPCDAFRGRAALCSVGLLTTLALALAPAGVTARLTVHVDSPHAWRGGAVGLTVHTHGDVHSLCIQSHSAPLPALAPHWQCGVELASGQRLVMDAPYHLGAGKYYLRLLACRQHNVSHAVLEATGDSAIPLDRQQLVASALPPFDVLPGDLVEVAVEVQPFSKRTASRFAGPFTTRDASPGRELFHAVDGLVADPGFCAAVHRSADDVGDVFVVMVNAPFVEQLANSVWVMRRFAGMPPPLVVCLDADCLRRVPGSFDGTALCDDCGDVAPWATRKFLDITRLKLVVVAAAVRCGVRAWWLDSDVLLYRDPRRHANVVGDAAATRIVAAGGPDAGGSPPLSAPRVWTATSLRHTTDVIVTYDGDSVELPPSGEALQRLCTGLFSVAPTTAGRGFLEHALHVMGASWSRTDNQGWYDDQAAVSIVAVTLPRPGLPSVVILMLSNADFPNGSVFFNTTLRPQLAGGGAVGGTHGVFAVHNNHLLGPTAKRHRLQQHGMWYLPVGWQWRDVVQL